MNVSYKFNDSLSLGKKEYKSYDCGILFHNNSCISTFKTVRYMYLALNDTCSSQLKYDIESNVTNCRES